MARDYRDHVKAAFAPLVDACNFQQSDKLMTADLPEERKQEQFDRFNKLTIDQARASPTASGGFVAIAEEGNKELLLVCAPSLNEQEVRAFENFALAKYSWPSIEVDEATFLVVVKELRGFLKLRSDFRNEASAQNFLDIIDDEYAGHDILAIMDAYQPVMVFEIDADNEFYREDVSTISLKIAAASPHLRSPILSNEIAEAIILLDGKVGCSSFNLEQAINAAQWRHAFLDIYRCLESLFFFPWVNELKSIANPELSILDLRDRCKNDLKWTAKEKESISQLFLMVNSPEMNSIERRETFFREVANDPNAKRDAFGRRVYFARNSLVHHEDRDQPDVDAPNSHDYQALTLYLCKFLVAFDEMYSGLWSRVDKTVN